MKGSGTRGSALIWAMMFVLIISILITSGLTIGLRMVNRAANAKLEQQAVYTARSVAEGVTEWLMRARITSTGALEGSPASIVGDAAAAAFILDQLKASGTVTVQPARLGLPEEMGECTLMIQGGTEGDLLVTASATVNGETSVVRSHLTRQTEFIPGTAAYIPPPPTPANPPLPPEEETPLPALEELAHGEDVYDGILQEEDTAENGATYLYPFELRRSEESVFSIDDSAEAPQKRLAFRFLGDHSPRFPPTIILQGDAPVIEEDAVQPEGEAEAVPADAEALIREARFVSLEGAYRSFRFYTGEHFAASLALGPMLNQPSTRNTRLYYTNASFSIAYGAGFRMAARAGLRNGTIETSVPTSISGALEDGSRLTVNADTTAIQREEYDAIPGPDGLARTDFQNNPRNYRPSLSEDSLILVKRGATLRVTDGDLLGAIYVEAGGTLELEGNPIVSGNIYLYAPEEDAVKEAAKNGEELLPAVITGDSEGLTATIYAHPDCTVDAQIIEAGRATLITSNFEGIAEEAIPATPDVTVITWGNPVYAGGGAQ